MGFAAWFWHPERIEPNEDNGLNGDAAQYVSHRDLDVARQ
jgi:hypothetical protein